jgi:crotonyl-CoA reductase
VSIDSLADAVRAGAPPDVLGRTPVPATYTAAHLRVEDVDMFRGVADKDVRKSLRVGEVEMPELAPDEVLVAVLASAVNYNTVWSATFEPIPTFQFLRRYGKQDHWAARHDQPFHVMGSDAAGVIVRTGASVRRWKIGDHVAISPVVVDDQEPATHNDAMMGAGQAAWGFENNFGGLAHYTAVRASQLLRKPGHLSWEEAAGIPLCAGTAYRMLVGEHGARMKQGDIVLVWGAVGGLGAYAVQLIKNGGGVAVGVVSSEAKAEAARRLGYDVVINRIELGIDSSDADHPEHAVELGKRLGKAIRAAVGEDPHIVFEHTGKLTFGISVFVVRRGGTVITCGSSSGYAHQFDNRYLWMKLKRIIGSHAANLHEMTECNRLVEMGRVGPVLSEVYPLTAIGEATRLVQLNKHMGKVGVLCLANEPGLGVTDPRLRERLGAERLNPLRNADASLVGAAR